MRKNEVKQKGRSNCRQTGSRPRYIHSQCCIWVSLGSAATVRAVVSGKSLLECRQLLKAKDRISRNTVQDRLLKLAKIIENRGIIA